MNGYRWLLYCWVAPVTVLALVPVLICVISGGRVNVVRGVLEARGGVLTPLFRRGNRWVGTISAMTLGHVILGRDEGCLTRCRFHEHVHIRQFEKWGVFLAVLYPAASLWCWLRGAHPYRDNPFEIEAYAAEAAHAAEQAPDAQADPAAEIA
ncbi:MAG: hypothetical protein JSS02_32630 [Planctomycetes bacterium]|nr:hypothetical protein [Planctomycetota bacterium]